VLLHFVLSLLPVSEAIPITIPWHSGSLVSYSRLKGVSGQYLCSQFGNSLPHQVDQQADVGEAQEDHFGWLASDSHYNL
jgi:hypothetical protein